MLKVVIIYMINIAICDDEAAICNYLEKILLKISEEYRISFDIDIYYTGQRLVDNLDRESYNLIFLDIEIPDIDGICIGNFIRDNLSNETIQIAYISSNTDYALQLFDFRPLNFIVKPFDYDDIKKVMKKYMKINNINTQVFSYNWRRKTYNIALSDILYFESTGREIIIHTVNGCDHFYSSIEDVYRSVKNNNFLFIHKSYIINCFHIAELEYKQVIMTNNDILPISQSRRTEIKSQYLHIKRNMYHE